MFELLHTDACEQCDNDSPGYLKSIRKLSWSADRCSGNMDLPVGCRKTILRRPRLFRFEIEQREYFGKVSKNYPDTSLESAILRQYLRGVERLSRLAHRLKSTRLREF